MNEAIFTVQILVVLLFCRGALRWGAEGLTAASALLAIFANLFVLKQMTFMGFEITCSDAFAIGSFLTLNLLREYHGQQAATRAVKVSFFSLAFVVLFSQIHLFFTPSIHDTTQTAYETLLKPAPRLLFASLAAFFLMQRFEIFLFSWCSKHLKVPFALRNSISLSISQFFDTLLFSLMGLYGLVAHLTHIVMISYAVKLLTILLLTPLTFLLKPKVHR